MADRLTLELQQRSILGKKVKRMRRAGVVPVHLYGPGITSRHLQCQGRELIKVLAEAGGNTPVTLTLEGEVDEHLAFVREIQWDPIKGDLFHVDFMRAEATQRVSAEVPVVLYGDSPGARQAMGSVVQQLRSITVEALPLDMPREISFDLTSLIEPDGVIRAADAPLPPDTIMLTDPQEVVARIQVAREEAVAGEVPAAGVETVDQEAQEG